MTDQEPLLRPDDALLLVDVQRDFLPGGALAVPDGDAVIGPDYCVLQTVLDARRLGFEVLVLRDAIAAVDAGDGAKALDDMAAAGAHVT